MTGFTVYNTGHKVGDLQMATARKRSKYGSAPKFGYQIILRKQKGRQIT